MKDTVLVTGGNGFIGSAVLRILAERGYTARATVRTGVNGEASIPGVEYAVAGDVGPDTEWGAAMEGVGVVIHLAARAHVLGNQGRDSLGLFREVNTLGTLRLARQAAEAGAKRFIYVSSIGVNGRSTHNVPFRESDSPRPDGPYAVSKWEAEQQLMHIQKELGLEVVVIRPPLVYGPGAPGNLGRLVRLIKTGIPLPFGALHNRRSMIGIENLASLLTSCIDHPAAAGEIFLAADGEDVSTPALITQLAVGLGRTVRLWPFPVAIMHLGAKLARQGALFDSLCGSLQVDATKARSLLGWKPEIPVAEGLIRAARGYGECSSG